MKIIHEMGEVSAIWPVLEFYTLWNIFGMAKAKDFKFRVRVAHVKCYSCDWLIVP